MYVSARVCDARAEEVGECVHATRGTQMSGDVRRCVPRSASRVQRLRRSETRAHRVDSRGLRSVRSTRANEIDIARARFALAPSSAFEIFAANASQRAGARSTLDAERVAKDNRVRTRAYPSPRCLARSS